MARAWNTWSGDNGAEKRHDKVSLREMVDWQPYMIRYAILAPVDTFPYMTLREIAVRTMGFVIPTYCRTVP